MPETSLGRIFEGLGVTDWEEIFPKKICEKCPLNGKECPEGHVPCAAIKVIGGLAVITTVNASQSSALLAEFFMKDLKKTLK